MITLWRSVSCKAAISLTQFFPSISITVNHQAVNFEKYRAMMLGNDRF
ncbi:hypothetical protein [Devosia sp.]|nr:hypothetical protein [Devosia sp.]MDP2779983.1 hypothetical protein [Devosia sp.]